MWMRATKILCVPGSAGVSSLVNISNRITEVQGSSVPLRLSHPSCRIVRKGEVDIMDSRVSQGIKLGVISLTRLSSAVVHKSDQSHIPGSMALSSHFCLNNTEVAIQCRHCRSGGQTGHQT